MMSGDQCRFVFSVPGSPYGNAKKKALKALNRFKADEQAKQIKKQVKNGKALKALINFHFHLKRSILSDRSTR